MQTVICLLVLSSAAVQRMAVMEKVLERSQTVRE